VPIWIACCAKREKLLTQVQAQAANSKAQHLACLQMATLIAEQSGGVERRISHGTE
jgi:hypothetical protein